MGDPNTQSAIKCVEDNIIPKDKKKRIINTKTRIDEKITSEFTFTFENIRYKNVIKGVSQKIEGGKMTAILGPSGAGKTTLLKIISGRKKKSSGVIHIGGKAFSEKVIRKKAAFVHQESDLISSLTVKEMLVYTIRLRRPEEINPDALAESLLRKLGLSHVKNSLIGEPIAKKTSISGGERKRVSIALELVSMPQILFLDEPTSGLDSYTTESLIFHLKNLADKGLLIAMTIHQPSSEVFSMFDNVIFMSKGNIVYSGPPEMCISYLESLGLSCPQYCNPADYIFRVLDQMPPIYTSFTDSTLQAPIETENTTENIIENTNVIENTNTTAIKKRRKRSFRKILQETRILMSRTLLCGARTKKYFIAKIFQAMVMAIVTGGLMYNIPGRKDYQIETNVCGCFWAISMGIFGSFSYGAITVLFVDRKMFLKEYGSNYYSFYSYFIAKVAVDFLVTSIFSLFGVPFIFLLTRIGSPLHLFACFCLSAVAHALGFFVGSFTDSSEVALVVFPGIVYPINFLTGNTVDTESIISWLKHIQYISPTRHLYNIMIKLHYANEKNISPRIQSLLDTFISVQGSFIFLILTYLILISSACLIMKRNVLQHAKK